MAKFRNKRIDRFVHGTLRDHDFGYSGYTNPVSQERIKACYSNVKNAELDVEGKFIDSDAETEHSRFVRIAAMCDTEEDVVRYLEMVTE